LPICSDPCPTAVYLQLAEGGKKAKEHCKMIHAANRAHYWCVFQHVSVPSDLLDLSPITGPCPGYHTGVIVRYTYKFFALYFTLFVYIVNIAA